MLEKLDFLRLFDQQTVWCLNFQYHLLVLHDLQKCIDLELFDPKLVGQDILQNCIENWLQDFCNHISEMVQMKLYRLIFRRSFLSIVMLTKSWELTVLTTWYIIWILPTFFEKLKIYTFYKLITLIFLHLLNGGRWSNCEKSITSNYGSMRIKRMVS